MFCIFIYRKTIQKKVKMKKLNIYVMMLILSLCSVPTIKNAAEKNLTIASNDTKEIPVEVKTMLNRLDEIKAMDKSSLNSTEKRAFVKNFEP